MNKKRGDKTNLHSVEYLILYLFGSAIFIVSYLYNIGSFFLVGLAIMIVSLYFSYLSAHSVKKKIKVVKSKRDSRIDFRLIYKRVKKRKKLRRKFKFTFPKLKFPKFPDIKSPKFKFPSVKLSKSPRKHKIRTDESKRLRLVVKHSGKITETDFDRLVNFVNQVGVMKISTVAKIFNISLKQAEEWGRILEEHNLLKLHYPPIGEPELRKWKK